MRGPDFLVIGAAKAGTSSLAAYLDQHPEIFVSSLKEPNYFAFRGTEPPSKGPVPPRILESLVYNWTETDRKAYYALFEDAGPRKAGEASVRYLYFPEAPHNIRAEAPDARIVAMLREPVRRLYSHYNMNVQKQLEPLGLRDALDAEQDRIAAGWGWDWHYSEVSRYSAQLERYIRLFGRDAVSIHLYEDFVREPQRVFSEICAHLGVDDRFRPDMKKRSKVPYRPRSAAFDRLAFWPNPFLDAMDGVGLGRPARAALKRAAILNRRPVPPLPKEEWTALSALFHDEAEALSDLMDRPVDWYRGT